MNSSAMDDVDLSRLIENIIHLTKKANIDDVLRDRILSSMNAFNNLMDCDLTLAHEFTRDLTIVRALIKKESDDLDRKFDIFEKKLRKLAQAILPRDENVEVEEGFDPHTTTTIFQDNDVRIIDTVNRKSAMTKMEEAREMVAMCKEIIKYTYLPQWPLLLKTSIQQRMNDILCLLKIDGGLAIKLKRDLLEVRAALQKGDEGIPTLENKLKILKIKLEKCSEEYDRREVDYQRLMNELDQQTDRALQLFDESTKGVTNKRWLTRRSIRDARSVPSYSDHKTTYANGTQMSQQAHPPIHSTPQGWMITPIDPATICAGATFAASYPSAVNGVPMNVSQGYNSEKLPKRFG